MRSFIWAGKGRRFLLLCETVDVQLAQSKAVCAWLLALWAGRKKAQNETQLTRKFGQKAEAASHPGFTCELLLGQSATRLSSHTYTKKTRHSLADGSTGTPTLSH